MSTEKSGDIEFGSGDIMPLLPLRDIVVFPHMIVPLFVGRDKSIAALEEVMNNDRQILLFTQKSAGEDDPAPESLYEIGTLATVLQLLKLPDGTVKVLVEGVSAHGYASLPPVRNTSRLLPMFLRIRTMTLWRLKHLPVLSSVTLKTM